MKKIMFNDLLGLTQATIDGRKTNTRRAEFDEAEQTRLNLYAEQGYRPFVEDNRVLVRDSAGTLLFSKPTRYRVGEEVAVVQSYEQIYNELLKISKYDAFLYEEFLSRKPGWRNKMFTHAVRMPHRIRITGIGVERLQDISDIDCVKEGIAVTSVTINGEATGHYYGYDPRLAVGVLNTPQDAFAALIDKVSGRGTWYRNPWVVAYEYELVK